MKTFLTFFILLFSSSVVADDDLSLKRLVCGYINDSDIIEINSWLFVTDNHWDFEKKEWSIYSDGFVLYHSYNPYADNFVVKLYSHYSGPTKITIYTLDGLKRQIRNSRSNTFALHLIDRTNLDVRFFGKEELLYNGKKNCIIIKIDSQTWLYDQTILFDFKDTLISNQGLKNLL